MILCCGEALIDMLPRETKDGLDAFVPHAGGAVFNTAIALGRLGAKVGLFSGLSNDLFGQVLSGALSAANVATNLVLRSDRPTTLAFLRLIDGQATYTFYDENTAGRLLATDDLPPLPDTITALFFGGISLVNDPAASAYATLQSRAAHRITMIDPNIRPDFITNETFYRARLANMLARADIVKVSEEDLRWIEGAGDSQTLVRSMLARGPKLVLLTEGASGARAMTATQNRHIAAMKTTVADTVGAGDTFNAGALAALHLAGALTKTALAALPDATLDAALSLGNRAAAITVSRAGANPPWEHEL